MNYTFKPLTFADFPLIVTWLNQPHVKRWWSTNQSTLITLEGVTKYLLPRVTGQVAIDCYIIRLNQQPIGYIQGYDARLFEPEGYAFGMLDPLVEQIARLARIDLYIGNPLYVGKGHGHSIVTQFLEYGVKQRYDACIVDVDSNNYASIRTFERAGFKEITRIEVINAKTILVMITHFL